MNRETIKKHCEATCKRFKEAPESAIYGEHRLILDLLEQTEWIPCSERLPEEPGIYLVSMYRLGYPQREVDGFVCGRWERFGNDVIAWCRIPEPYKDESKIEQALAHADQDTLMSAT